jgi:hypothetical protein
MLKIPFKDTEQISFKKPLQDAIQAVFGEDPAQYDEDLDIIDDLRLHVIDPQEHDSSAQTHLTSICV